MTVYIYYCCQNERVNASDTFFQFNALNIFKTVNTGAGLKLATPLYLLLLSNFFLTMSAFIQSQQVLMTTSNRARVKRARKRYCAHSACSCTQNAPARAVAFIISYQSAKKWACNVNCRLRHEITKKAIKAASKLSMHVIFYIWVTLRTCLWNGFQICPEAPQHCLPHLTLPIQPVSSLVETEMGPNWSGSEKVELRENTMRVRSASHSTAAALK